MGFVEDLAKYSNSQTNLVGHTPNEAGFSSGNPLLETGTAWVLRNKLNLLPTSPLDSVDYSFCKCLNLPFFYCKLPNIHNSRISHDDTVGMVAGWGAVSAAGAVREDIIRYGEIHHWVFSSDGTFYWDALTKPWHYAFYMLAAHLDPGYIAKLFLFGFVAFDALFNTKNSSDKKLMWLMLETIKGRSKLIDIARDFWWWRLYKTWGSMGNVFAIYYGPNHLFTLYCRE